ncbi:Wolframin family, partial [Trinorchestia longiramus]
MAATLPTSGHRSSDNTSDFTQERSTIQRSRRQWNIQEGPRGVLRRMRSQLAEEGDPDSQVVLAKSLLSSDEDVECSRQAVYWLTKASLQGHCGATELLQECLRTATGISEHNYHEVCQCLDMPLQEKLARRAANSLFVSLSGGSDFVTSSMLASYIRQLLRRGSDSSQISPPSSPQPCSLEERYGGERFLQEHLTAAATSYYQGQLPTLHQFLPTLCIHETRKDDWMTARETSTSLDASSNKNIKSNVPRDTFSNSLPLVCLVLSLATMIISSATIFMNYRYLDQFKVWSVLLKHHCPELSTGAAYHPVNKDRKVDLKWTAFRNICVPSKNVEAETWIACQPLQGMLVSWSGEVVDVRVTSVTNWPKSLLSVLPLPEEVRNFVACRIGREVSPCNRVNMELVDYERCVLVTKILDMASYGDNTDLEDEQFELLEEGSIPSPDGDLSVDGYDEYSDTISDIVSRVMSMDNAPKRQSLLFGRLRQSLPPLSRPALSATTHNVDATPLGDSLSRYKQHARAHVGDGSSDLHHSSSKMVRSVSTPEISNKYSYNPPKSLATGLRDRKTPIIRKMNFLDLPRSVKHSSEQDLPMMDLDLQFDTSPSFKRNNRAHAADASRATAGQNKENVCPAVPGMLREEAKQLSELSNTPKFHSSASKRLSSEVFKEPYASLYSRSGASVDLPSSKPQPLESARLLNRHPPSSNPLATNMYTSSCSYFGNKTPRSVVTCEGNAATAASAATITTAAARGDGDFGSTGSASTAATSRADAMRNSNRPQFLPWSSRMKHNAHSNKLGQESQFAKHDPRALPVRSVLDCDSQRSLQQSNNLVPSSAAEVYSQSTGFSCRKPPVSVGKHSIPYVVVTPDIAACDGMLADPNEAAPTSSDHEGRINFNTSSSRLENEDSNSSPSVSSFEQSNLSSNSSKGDSTLRNDSFCSRGDSVLGTDTTNDLLESLNMIDPCLQSALKKLDASLNSTHSSTITNMLKPCKPNTASGLNLVSTSTSNSILGSIFKASTTVASNTSGSLLSSSTATTTDIHTAEQKSSSLYSQSCDISSRACGSAFKSSSSGMSSTASGLVPTSVHVTSASDQSLPSSAKVTCTISHNSVQVPSTPGQVTSAPVQVTLAPVQVTSVPVQVTSAPVQVTSVAVQVTSAPVQVTSAPVQVTSAPVQVTSAPVQVTLAPVQVTSVPVQVTSASTLVQPAPAPVRAVPASFPCMESLYVHGKQYMKLSLLGRGGSSEVYE